MKFTPTTRGDYFEVKNGLEQFTRKVKIREIFWGQQYTNDSLVRNKSTKTFTSKNIDVKNLVRSIEALEPEQVLTEDNLTPGERNALAELRNNPDIIIKPADKGSSIVVMNTEYYRDKLVLGDHLLTDSYEKVDTNCDEIVMQQLSSLLTKHSTCLTEKEIDYVTNDDWKTSEFYVLPKVHKCKAIIERVQKCTEDVVTGITDPPDLKGRPLVAGCSTPTRGLSELISKILKPSVESQKSYVKDDWDVLGKLPRDTDGSHKLFGCDITSLYTSIPHDLGLEAIRYWIRKRRDLIAPRFSEAFILESIELMLKNNNFYFNDDMFQQLIGTAMGHVFAPQYACLVIGYLEEEHLFKDVLQRHFSQSDIDVIASYYSRYMDDGNTLLPESVDAQVFLQCLNSLHPNIGFTLEPANNTVIEGKPAQTLDFLDITIILFGNGTLETDIYYKPTNSHQYLDYSSFHPLHIKDNIPFGLAKRIICFVSNPTVMEHRLTQLRSWLCHCNYPKKVIDKSIYNARLQGPAPKPVDKNDVIPFITTYASNLNTKNITNDIRTLINRRQHGRLEEVLENVKVVAAYKQPPNLGRLLTHAKFRDTTTNEEQSTTPKVNPGIFASCTDPRCKLCSLGYIQQCTSFECANGKVWEIKSHITCNSKNVIYYLVCNMCNVVSNAGKTEQKLRGRMNDHISKCKSGKGTDKFDKHVHECGKKHRSLEPPYFKIYAFMVLSSKELLLTYESYLHRNGFDTMNRVS